MIAAVIIVGYLAGALGSYLFIQNRSRYIFKTRFKALTEDEYFDGSYYGLLVFSTILWPFGLPGFVISHAKYL